MITAASRSIASSSAASASGLTAASRMKTDYEFFTLLFRAGQRAARRFLNQHFDDIGVRSTLDLATESGVEWA